MAAVVAARECALRVACVDLLDLVLGAGWQTLVLLRLSPVVVAKELDRVLEAVGAQGVMVETMEAPGQEVPPERCPLDHVVSHKPMGDVLIGLVITSTLNLGNES